MTSVQELIGQRISKFRKAANFKTRAELANMIQEKEDAFGRWERGERMIPYGKLVLICAVLSVTPNDLIPGPWNSVRTSTPPDPDAESINAAIEHLRQVLADGDPNAFDE